MQAVIEARHLSKSYPGGKGVHDLNFVVGTGEIFGYLGPNGSGKTTTIRMLLGLARPSRGRLKLFGLPAGHRHLRRDGRIGYLPGELGLYETMTGDQALGLYADLTGRPPVLREWLCERLEFHAPDRRRRIKAYSKGMRQKLGLVQALQHDPELAVLDEPTSGLDPLSQQELAGILREMRDRGRTIFFSSHVLSEAFGICDRIGVLVNGRLAMDSEVADLVDEADRLLYVRFETDAGDGADDVPPIRGAAFERREGAWLVYRAKSAATARILAELTELAPADFRFEAALEDAFLNLYRGRDE